MRALLTASATSQDKSAKDNDEKQFRTMRCDRTISLRLRQNTVKRTEVQV
jgi:hypothetical protein